MAILNITYQGLSVDHVLDVNYELSDHEIRRIAVEVVRSGALRGLQIANLPDSAFDNYVVDRSYGRDANKRVYLRPKVPFGAPGASSGVR